MKILRFLEDDLCWSKWPMPACLFINLPVADTFLWGQIVDKAIFTARQGKTSVKSAKFALERMKQANIKIIGCVINDCRQSGTPYGEYGYYKSYYNDK